MNSSQEWITFSILSLFLANFSDRLVWYVLIKFWTEINLAAMAAFLASFSWLIKQIHKYWSENKITNIYRFVLWHILDVWHRLCQRFQQEFQIIANIYWFRGLHVIQFIGHVFNAFFGLDLKIKQTIQTQKWLHIKQLTIWSKILSLFLL